MMKTSMHKDRPRYLNVIAIHLPVTGVVSILHRLSGVFLLLCIPICAFLLATSLRDAEGFELAVSLTHEISMRALLGLGLWALSHHFFAGVRFLLFDIDLGVHKASARRAAWFVIIADVLALAAIVGWFL